MSDLSWEGESHPHTIYSPATSLAHWSADCDEEGCGWIVHVLAPDKDEAYQALEVAERAHVERNHAGAA